MTDMLYTRLNCTVHAKKVETVFDWSLEDWLLLSNKYFNNFRSPAFVLNRRYACHLEIRNPSDLTVYFIITKKSSTQILASKMSVSLVDGSLKNLITIDSAEQGFKNYPARVCIKTPDALKYYLRNDTLRLLCKITTVHEIIQSTVRTGVRNNDFRIDSYKQIEIDRTKESYDVTFFIEGKKLLAHKFVLAENSDVFKAMFTAQMKEQKEGVVNITDAKFVLFDAFIKYMYTGQVENMEAVAEDLIFVADKYQVESLKNVCEQFMVLNLSTETLSKYLRTAHELSCEELRTEAEALLN